MKIKELKKPVVLVGMMGAGKSSVGRELAKMLGLKFYDTDALIEEKWGASISEIFEKRGEVAFRIEEKETVNGLLQDGPCVVSTGGGAVTNPETLQTIKSKGISVWLKADAALLFARVKNKPGRPLLQKENPEAVLRELLAAREPLYAKADIIIKSSGNNARETAQAIINALYKR